MKSFAIVDMIFLILIVVMIFHGYVRGLIAEIFSWASLILGIFAAVSLYHSGAGFIRTKIMQTVKYVPEIISFLIVFFAVILLLKMLEHVLKEIIEGAKLGGIDKFLGLLFGLIEGLALVTIILFVLTVQPLFDASKIIGDSFFAQLLIPLIQIPLNRGREVIKSAAFIMQNSGHLVFLI